MFVQGSQEIFGPARARAAVAAVGAPDYIDRVRLQRRSRTAPQQSVTTNCESATIAAVTQLVQLSSRHAWPIILSFALLAILSASHFARHFAISTDSNKLLSSSLLWRQQETMLGAAFPQRIDQIIAVIERGHAGGRR